MSRTQRQFIKRKRRIIKFAKIAAFLAALGIAIVTGVATFILFPGLGIPFAIAVGIAGFIMELATYWHDTQKASLVIFAKGIFSNLENNLIANKFLSDRKTDKKIFKKMIKRSLENNERSLESSPLRQTLLRIKQNMRRELFIKKTLSAVALGYVILNGFSIVAITYTHSSLMIQQIIFWSLGASFVATLPWFAPLLTVLFALICGYAYSQMMYRLLSRSIEKNSIKKLFYSLKKMFSPHKSWRSMALSDWLLFATKCLLVSTLFLAVLGLSALVTFFSGTTLLNQNILFLQAFVTLFVKLSTAATVINMTSAVLIYGFFLPTAFLFAFENSWETVRSITKKIISICAHPGQIKDVIFETIATLKNDPTQWWKLPGLIIGALIVSAALLLHVIGEGARASESLAERGQIGLKIFDHISNFFEKIIDGTAMIFNTSAVLFTIMIESILEILEHLPFLQGGHHHGDSITNICAKGTYSFMNLLFRKHSSPTLENTKTKTIGIQSEAKSNTAGKFLSFFKVAKTPEHQIEIEMESLITPTLST